MNKVTEYSSGNLYQYHVCATGKINLFVLTKTKKQAHMHKGVSEIATKREEISISTWECNKAFHSWECSKTMLQDNSKKLSRSEKKHWDKCCKSKEECFRGDLGPTVTGKLFSQNITYLDTFQTDLILIKINTFLIQKMNLWTPTIHVNNAYIKWIDSPNVTYTRLHLQLQTVLTIGFYTFWTYSLMTISLIL